MTRLLLAQDVFLLAHDDESGKNTASLALQGALAGALLLDLVERDLVVVGDDSVRATDAVTDDPLLARAQQVVREQDEPRRVGWWLSTLPRRLKPLDRTVGESLVERGILGEEQGKVLGIFSTTRWPELDPEPERQLRAELADALLQETEPTPRVLLLAGLLSHYGMVDRLFEKSDRKRARTRAGELAELAESSDAVSRALGESVRAAQVALLAATVATNAASRTASTNS
ncbi:GOLPH3/VPS74 family protein [Jatrophihabitans sp. YIM 134969]